MGEMTTKPPSAGLAASGPADEPDPEQITKEHTGEGQNINIDPSDDVTVEASEDVTTEASSHTPSPSFDVTNSSPGQRAPTLLGVPIQSLPLPGVTANSLHVDETRTIDYDEEVTVLAPAKPADPLAALDAAMEDDDRPSITDDDEEETKVEPAEAAMKAAGTLDDVTTALSAQASVEREKALRRSAPPLSSTDDLEFADPEGDDDLANAADDQADDQADGEPEESLDEEIDDDDEVISAGGAIEEEEDELDAGNDGVATATFMKPADSTGLSGLLNPRRPPTGSPFGREGFGSARLPTPYPAPSAVPAPSTSPFASRLGPAPIGSAYAARATGPGMPAIQVTPPSGAAATAAEPGFLTRRVPVPAYGLITLVAGGIILGYGLGGLGGGKSLPATPTMIVAKPAVAPATAAAVPVVEPVGTTATTAAVKPAAPTEAPKPPPAPEAPTITRTADTTPGDTGTAETAGLLKPAKKPAALKVHKPATDVATEDAALKPATPKPAKPAKKPSKAWVDPFAQ